MKTLGSPNPLVSHPCSVSSWSCPRFRVLVPNDVLPFKTDVDVEETTLLQDTFFSEDCCGGNLPDTPHKHTTPTKTLKTPHLRHHHSTWVGVSYLLKLAIWLQTT